MSKPFEAITWGQYLGIAFAVVAIYYLYVAATYYRVEILAMLKGKGKGNAADALVVATTARPSLVGGSGSGPLIPKAALVIDSAATEEEEAGAKEPEVTRPEEAEEDETLPDEVNIEEPIIDNINNLNHEEDAEALPGLQAADSEDGFTVGVAQLSDYFDDAAEGNITQEELVAQMPELDNSALLVAFFQSSAKATQQLTAQYYVDVPEPVLD